MSVPARLRIVEARCRVVGGSTAAVGNARHRWRERRGILLTVRDQSGAVGQGEASPLERTLERALDVGDGAEADAFAARARSALDLGHLEEAFDYASLAYWRGASELEPVVVAISELLAEGGLDDEALERAGELGFTSRPSGIGLGLFVLRFALRDRGGVRIERTPEGCRSEVFLRLNTP